MNLNPLTQTKKTRSSIRKNVAFATVVFGLSLLGNTRASATILYATSSTDNVIYQDDSLIPNSVAPYFTAQQDPDSLMFDATGINLIYTEITPGQVRSYNPITHVDSLVASGLSGPADVALEPGGATMLVSEFYGGKIDRINLTTHAVTTLYSSPGTNPEGMAFDGVGNLFANLGVRNGTAATKYVAQIDTMTGMILHQSPNLPSLDGLTYDSFTHMLYAASLFGNTVYQIDPNNLNNVVDLGHAFGGSIPGADGITSDGLGHVFVASAPGAGGDGHIYDISLINHTITQGDFISMGLDDLAPASGLGSQQVPEPSSLALTGIGFVGLLVARRRMKSDRGLVAPVSL